jgi:hypothetical protein
MSVIDEVTSVLHCEAILHAAQKASEYTAKLEQIAATDWDKVKTDLKNAAAHFEAEIKRLEGLVDPKVVEHLQTGVPPKVAVANAIAGTPAESLIAKQK